MHIMVVNNLYPPIFAGGAERIVSYLCEGLVRRSHRVTVVSTCGPEMEPYPTEVRNGVEIIRFFPPNIYWSHDRDRGPGLKKWMWHGRDAWNRRAAERFRSILAATKPDIVHTHLIDGFSASIWAEAQRFGIRVVHTAHDYHLMCPRAFMLTRDWKVCSRPNLPCRLYRFWHIRTTRHIDLFVSPSQFLLELHEVAGLRSPRCALVYNGIPLPDDGRRLQPRATAAHPHFIMLTRLTVEKGIQVVLDAVSKLSSRLQFKLTIAGIGPLEELVRDAADRDRRINYLGFVDGTTKENILSQADYLLLPSLWYENAPVTIVEAAAHGIGVIGSHIGAIPEFVHNGETGILFSPGDAGALAAIMKRIIEHPQEALQALPGRSRALAERFTVDRMIESYESHYLMLLGGQPRRVAA
ncbi:MAG: glycosyltransferase [Rhodospirillaceae bacterium]|nr:MAG: glycosyltransferase [Rhodospirillaceae bacterium]